MNSSDSRTLILKTVALFAAWLVLSQSSRPFHLAVGFTASLLVARLNTGRGQPTGPKMRWGRMILYVPWLLWKVLQSGMHMSYLILHPRFPIDPKLIRYQTRLEAPAGIVILGNSITLTPGTITAEVNSSELVIHAMDDPSGEDLISFERKIAKIFGAKS